MYEFGMNGKYFHVDDQSGGLSLNLIQKPR